MESADVFINTYWIRFPYRGLTFNQAIENTRTLFHTAKNAGIKRIVHISITNPSLSSSLPYFRGKALIEKELKDLGVSYAIIRPTVIFGKEDILINNIAYLLRRFPLFIIPGKGNYKIQPIFVEDLANLVVETMNESNNITIDAVGPETYTFRDLILEICTAIHKYPTILHSPPWAIYIFSKLFSLYLNDILLTKNEIHGLMNNLLISHQPPLGKTSFRQWVRQNHDTLGTHYASELAHHYQR